MKLTIHQSDSYFLIEINGLTHVWKDEKLTGIMSYMTTGKNFFIEYHFSNNQKIVGEYDKRGLWERILKLIKKT